MAEVIVGIDLGKYKASICLIDTGSNVVEAVELDSTSTAMLGYLLAVKHQIRVIAFETGVLFRETALSLTAANLPVIVIDARTAAPFLRTIKAAKTDENDAYAIAELVRRDAHTAVWLKSPEAARILNVLTMRENLIRAETMIRASMLDQMLSRGHKTKHTSRKNYHAQIGEFIRNNRDFSFARKSHACLTNLSDAIVRLDKEVKVIADRSEICRLLMSVPAIGPKTAVLYRAIIDHPQRFAKSRDVGAYLGLVPGVRQSGRSTYHGRITRMGPKQLRTSLFMAGTTLLFTAKKDLHIRRWGLAVAERRGRKKAIIAVARRLAVEMHRIWLSGEPFQDR